MPITNMSFPEFEEKYYPIAKTAADMTIAGIVRKQGPINRSIDVDLVKDQAVEKALGKVYDNYDANNPKHASIDTFMKIVVKNSVIDELQRESKATGRGKGRNIDALLDMGKGYRFSQYGQYYLSFKRKEDAINDIMDKIHMLKEEDQVILYAFLNEGKSGYVKRALEDLELEDSKKNRDRIYLRFFRLLKTLNNMFDGKKPNYREMSTWSGKRIDYQAAAERMYSMML